MVKSAGNRLLIAFKGKAVSWTSSGRLSTGVWSCSLAHFALLKCVIKACSRSFSSPLAFLWGLARFYSLPCPPVVKLSRGVGSRRRGVQGPAARRGEWLGCQMTAALAQLLAVQAARARPPARPPSAVPLRATARALRPSHSFQHWRGSGRRLCFRSSGWSNGNCVDLVFSSDPYQMDYF